MTDFVDVTQVIPEVLSLEDPGSDFVDVTQVVVEVLSLSLEDPGSDFVDVTQVVVEVLSLAPADPEGSIYINTTAEGDPIHIQVPVGAVTIHMMKGG